VKSTVDDIMEEALDELRDLFSGDDPDLIDDHDIEQRFYDVVQEKIDEAADNQVIYYVDCYKTMRHTENEDAIFEVYSDEDVFESLKSGANSYGGITCRFAYWAYAADVRGHSDFGPPSHADVFAGRAPGATPSKTKRGKRLGKL